MLRQPFVFVVNTRIGGRLDEQRMVRKRRLYNAGPER